MIWEARQRRRENSKKLWKHNEHQRNMVSTNSVYWSVLLILLLFPEPQQHLLCQKCFEICFKNKTIKKISRSAFFLKICLLVVIWCFKISGIENVAGVKKKVATLKYDPKNTVYRHHMSLIFIVFYSVFVAWAACQRHREIKKTLKAPWNSTKYGF